MTSSKAWIMHGNGYSSARILGKNASGLLRTYRPPFGFFKAGRDGSVLFQPRFSNPAFRSVGCTLPDALGAKRDIRVSSARIEK